MEFRGIRHKFHQILDERLGWIEIRCRWLADGLSIGLLEDFQFGAELMQVGLVKLERGLPQQVSTVEQHYYLLSLEVMSTPLSKVFSAVGALRNSFTLGMAIGDAYCRDKMSKMRIEQLLK